MCVFFCMINNNYTIFHMSISWWFLKYTLMYLYIHFNSMYLKVDIILYILVYTYLHTSVLM